MPDQDVKINSWPKEAAKLSHEFGGERPCPVAIQFGESVARIAVETTAKDPINVDMAMNLSAREALPICIKVCEPICAESEYVIGIQIFDRPVATITVRGKTTLFNANEE
jgi:hypothetical protein